MELINLPREDFSVFSKNIAQRFEFDIKPYECDATLSILSETNINFTRYKKAEDIKIKIDDLKPGDIHFYSRTEKSEVYYLLKHLRNCASHSCRIFYTSIEDEEQVVFTDKSGKKNTLLAILPKAQWQNSIDILFHAYIEHINK